MLRQWLQRLTRSHKPPPRPARPSARLSLECLEDRTLPAAVTWIGPLALPLPAGGDWNVASNWDLGRLPQAADEVFIPEGIAGARVVHSELVEDVIMSLNSRMDIAITGGGLVLRTDSFVSGRLAVSGGTLQLGGYLSVVGAYVQTASGALTVHIAGINPGSDYDQLWVDGPARLAGGLNVLVSPAFVPDTWDGFAIVDSSSRIGTFDWVRGLKTPNGNYGILYGPTFVMVLALPDEPTNGVFFIDPDDILPPSTDLLPPLPPGAGARLDLGAVLRPVKRSLDPVSSTNLGRTPSSARGQGQIAAVEGSGGASAGSSGGMLEALPEGNVELPALADGLEVDAEREALNTAISRSLLTGTGPRGAAGPVAVLLRNVAGDAKDAASAADSGPHHSFDINPAAPLPTAPGSNADSGARGAAWSDEPPALIGAAHRRWDPWAEAMLAGLVLGQQASRRRNDDAV